MAEMYSRGTENGTLPYTSAMNMRAFLAQRSIFSLDDFARSFPDLSLIAAKKQLLRAKGRGEVKPVGRGLYAVVPGGQSPDTHRPDPFLFLHARIPDAVFCGHSALELNGLAYSVWNQVTAYTTGNRASFRREGTKYRLLQTPKMLVGENAKLGLNTIDRNGTMIQTLGPERTLVEGFRSPKDFGGLSEFLSSVEHLERVKETLLLELLSSFGEKKLYACLGWFLENHKANLAVSDLFLTTCHENQPKAPVYLARKMGQVQKVLGWNLLMPEQLLHMEDQGAPEF